MGKTGVTFPHFNICRAIKIAMKKRTPLLRIMVTTKTFLNQEVSNGTRKL
jgi:hypothetical protein